MVWILQGAKLPLQQHRSALLQGLVQEHGYIAHERRHHVPVSVEGLQQLLRFDYRLVVQVLEKHILQLADPLRLLPQNLLVEKLAYLEADLGIFIGIERRDAGFGGAEGLPAQPFLLVLVQQNVVGHDNLRPIRHQQLRAGDAALHQRPNLLKQQRDVQRHAVAYDIRDMAVEHAGRKGMQREFPVVVHDGVPRVGAALKPNYNVGFLRYHVRDLAFSLIAPVGPYDCLDHNSPPFPALGGRTS